MQGLQERLFEQITAVLDPNEEVSPVVKSGGWKAVWSKACSFFAKRPVDCQAEQDVQQVWLALHVLPHLARIIQQLVISYIAVQKRLHCKVCLQLGSHAACNAGHGAVSCFCYCSLQKSTCSGNL